jgi:hypothetical protein
VSNENEAVEIGVHVQFQARLLLISGKDFEINWIGG